MRKIWLSPTEDARMHGICWIEYADGNTISSPVWKRANGTIGPDAKRWEASIAVGDQRIVAGLAEAPKFDGPQTRALAAALTRPGVVIEVR